MRGDAAVADELAAGLRRANVRLRGLLAGRDARIAELETRVARIAELEALVEGLQAQVADLAARVKQNSKNSSRPPSGDGLGKPAPESLRTKTGRKPGRPEGQPGATMQLTDHPDHVITHEPSCCAGCGTGLDGAQVTGVERRQVTEIPPVRAEVTGHRMLERECPCCGKRTKAGAPAGAAAPVQYGPRAAAIAAYLWHGQFLSRDRACAALAEMFGCAPSPAVISTAARKIAAFISPAIDAIVTALIASQVAHFGETGFRVAGKLAWVHSASAGKYVLVTVHPRRGKQGMDAAGVLPAFTGIACHDAWAPYDTCDGVAGHALCNAHVLRELAAVTETGTPGDVIWAKQAIDALLALKKAAEDARGAGHGTIEADLLARHSKYFRDAADAGIVLNAARRSALQKKRHALAARMQDRAGDYLRFAHDLRVPFDNDLASHCTSWVRSAASGFSRWSGRVAGVVLSIACGTDIFRQRAAEAGVVAAS